MFFFIEEKSQKLMPKSEIIVSFLNYQKFLEGPLGALDFKTLII